MSVDFTSRAVELFKKAAAHDEAKEYDDAYKWYMEAIDVFMTAIKYENKNPTKKDMLKKKVTEIMDRAEKIKSYLDAAKGDGSGGGTNNAGGSATGTKAAGKRDKGKEDDDEKANMRKGLEGAIVKSKPNVPWSNIAGLEGAKEALKEAVVLPVRFPQLFTGNRKPWRGILLYGPPGTGKSYLAAAVATETDGTFFSVSSADLMSRWLGDSEKLVRNLFEMAREAKRQDGKPAIIFIDEIDSMCGSRSEGESDATRRIKTEFLVQMQGVGNQDEQVLVLAATNIPWGLDSAIRRRFERRIYIPLPDSAARAQMFRIHLGDTPHELNDEDFQELGDISEMYSGSDINVVVRNAMMESVRTLQFATHFKRVAGPDPDDPSKMRNDRLVPCSPGDPDAFPMTMTEITEPKLVMSLPVTKLHFIKALRTARPSVCDSDIQDHIKFTQDFGQEG
jgi:vacuolar protein-sorting-associated protein 4